MLMCSALSHHLHIAICDGLQLKKSVLIGFHHDSFFLFLLFFSILEHNIEKSVSFT